MWQYPCTCSQCFDTCKSSMVHRPFAGVLDKLEALHRPQPPHQTPQLTLVQHTDKLMSSWHSGHEWDNSDFARRQSSPAASYFGTNVAAAAEPKPRKASPPDTRAHCDVLEAVRPGRLPFDASLAFCTAGLPNSEPGIGASATYGRPADKRWQGADQPGIPASDAASLSPKRAGQTPFEMAAVSSPFSSGGSTAGGNSTTPAMSEPQSSSEDQNPAEEPSAAGQLAAAPASGFQSAFKSPFEVRCSFQRGLSQQKGVDVVP